MRGSSSRERIGNDQLNPSDSSPGTGILGGPWLLLGADGRLTAYLHIEGTVLRWTETRVGGVDGWSGPEEFPAPQLTEMTVAQGADKYVHFFARRVRAHADGRPRIDLMHAIQYQSGRPLSPWLSVGNPFKAADPASAGLGAPVGAVDNRGVVYVFAPDGTGNVRFRREDAHGRWEVWRDLQVSGVTAPPMPAVASTGTMELVAGTGWSGLHWYQKAPGGAFHRTHDLNFGPVDGTAAAVETAPGRHTFYLADAGGSGVVAHRGGSWPVSLGGNPPRGRIAALRMALDRQDCTVIAFKDGAGRLMLGICVTEAEQSGVWWSDTGMSRSGDPALILDGCGRLVMMAVAPDGELALTRQSAGEGLALEPWGRL